MPIQPLTAWGEVHGRSQFSNCPKKLTCLTYSEITSSLFNPYEITEELPLIANEESRHYLSKKRYFFFAVYTSDIFECQLFLHLFECRSYTSGE